MHSRLLRACVMCVAAGSMVSLAASPALADGSGGSGGKCSGMSAAMRGKSEAARKKIRTQYCKRMNDGLKSAVESAAKAMRSALHTFHDATDDDVTPLPMDEQVNALALVAQGQLGDALAAGMAAITAAHDKAIADLTAAGAPQAQLDAVEKQTGLAQTKLQRVADCAARKLAEMVAEALAANDPVDPGAGGAGGTGEPTEPNEPAEPAGSHP